MDISALLKKKNESLQQRTIFVHNRQDWRPPMDEDQTCIINDKWRLVNGVQLYDIEKDRLQEHDVAKQHPELVEQLLSDNERFLMITKANPEYTEFPLAIIGNPNQKEVKLTIQHAIGEGKGIWKSEQVAEGMKNVNNTHALKVEREGTYLISCRRWPKECEGPVLGIPAENPKNWFTYKSIAPQKVRISIANQMYEKEIQENDMEVAFKVHLEKGKTFLVNDFIDGKQKYGVYYTYVSLLSE